MILPIGHEQSGVRRLPWVSFAVMALCFLVFLATKPSDSATDAGAEELYEALEYYFEHPYLELPPSLQDALGMEDEWTSEELVAAMRESIPPPEAAGTLQAEQAELDSLVERALESLGVNTYMKWGLVPAEASAPAWITHMFMHAGWLHLLGNLLIFYLAAPFIEDVWGRPLFAVFYILSGLAAALAQVVRFPDSAIPMVGASGAIAGVMGAFLVRYWHTKIRFFYIFGFIIRGTFDAPAWVMLPLWFGTQVFFAMLTDSLSAGGGVAYWAHIGGFVFGAGAAFAIKHYRVEERYLHEAIETKVTQTVVDNTEVDQALEAHGRGESDASLRSLEQLVHEQPSNEDAVLAFWSLAVETGRPEVAAEALVRLVESEIRAGHIEIALNHWAELGVRVTHPPAGPELLVRLSQILAREGRRDEAAIAVRRAMLEAGSGMTSNLALRIARAARDVDVTLAQGAARLLLSRPELDPADRAHAQEILESAGGSPRSG